MITGVDVIQFNIAVFDYVWDIKKQTSPAEFHFTNEAVSFYFNEQK